MTFQLLLVDRPEQYLGRKRWKRNRTLGARLIVEETGSIKPMHAAAAVV
jgi:hypothetical protein